MKDSHQLFRQKQFASLNVTVSCIHLIPFPNSLNNAGFYESQNCGEKEKSVVDSFSSMVIQGTTVSEPISIHGNLHIELL